MDYKELWQERYEELAYELYACEYWELSPDKRVEVADKTEASMRDWLADQIDAARDRMKYEGLA